MNIMLNEAEYMPTRAHAVDAGIDYDVVCAKKPQENAEKKEETKQ